MENYEHIYYQNCPNFTVGHVDQWGESGYLLFEGNVYFYEEDRKDQCGSTHSPLSILDFLAYAKNEQIAIPEEFMKELTKHEND